MKPPPFAYHDPTSIEEALDLLQHSVVTPRCSPAAEFDAAIELSLSFPTALVDINHIAALSYIQHEQGSSVLAL